jgi:hypothetical protein
MLRLTYVFYQIKSELPALRGAQQAKVISVRQAAQLFCLLVICVYVYSMVYIGVPHCKESFIGVHYRGLWTAHLEKLIVLFYIYCRYLVFYYTICRVRGQYWCV